jgi:signal transduction histidine kinase
MARRTSLRSRVDFRVVIFPQEMPAPATPSESSFKILYVDDEALSLKYFQQIVGEDFEVITASSAEEGLMLAEELHHTLAVVVSDQRLTGMQGTKFLAELRQRYPNIVRILATAFAELSTAVSAINDGAIFYFVSKPWQPEALLVTLRRAVDHFALRAERDRLLAEKAAMIREMMAAERLADYGVLAEGMSHHLRNALVPVDVYLQFSGPEGADLGAAGMSDPQFLAELRDSAAAQVRRMTEILGRFADVHEVSGSFEEGWVSIRQTVENAILQLGTVLHEKQLNISLVGGEELPAVHTCRRRVHRVIRLVIEDAIERLGPGSDIHISLQHKSAEPDREHVLMEVWDSGPPVEPQRLGSIFTPFAVRRHSPQHLGVSLATCYVTLSSIGGWARAFNDPARGTVIACGLPIEMIDGKTAPRPSLEAWDAFVAPKTAATG